jgi:hypothetical protein
MGGSLKARAETSVAMPAVSSSMRRSVAGGPTDPLRSVGGHPSIVSPAHLREIFASSQRKLFSVLRQLVAPAPHSVGTVGTGLALLLPEQMLKRVTNFFKL